VIDDSELRDCDFGRWHGRSLEELQSEEFQSLIDWLNDIRAAPHAGESFYKLMTRVGTWLDRQRDVGPVIAVTHGSVIRAAVVHAMQGSPHQSFLRLEVSPLTATDIRFSNGFWRIRSVGVPLKALSLTKSVW
jgi:broad specificity phosphatase PhoE